jgi:transposase
VSKTSKKENTMETPVKEKYSTEKRLYMGMELSQSHWKLGFNVGMEKEPQVRQVKAGEVEALQAVITAMKKRYKLGAESQVKSCYEAGLDGFWIHRYLTAQGIENVVVDPASIEVNRRAKQRKTDRLDARKLVRHLIRYEMGEKEVWRVIQVPSEDAEAQRHLHRQLTSLQNDWKRHRNRIYGCLKTQGLALKVGKNFQEELEQVRCWNGAALPAELQGRVEREYRLMQVLKAEMKSLEDERQHILENRDSRDVKMIHQLLEIRGVGINSAWLLVREFFGWRTFRNRRQVGGLAGLGSTPYASGARYRDQGISKAGNRWVRAMMVQLAWAWLFHQPNSKLSRVWRERYAKASKAERKKGIVALARQLLVALWRYVDQGTVPEDAQLKTDR